MLLSVLDRKTPSDAVHRSGSIWCSEDKKLSTLYWGFAPWQALPPQLDPLPVLRLASRSLTFLRIWYSGNPVIPIIALSDKRRNVFYIVITNLWPIAQKGGDLLAAVHKSYQYFSLGSPIFFGLPFSFRDNYEFMITGTYTFHSPQGNTKRSKKQLIVRPGRGCGPWGRTPRP